MPDVTADPEATGRLMPGMFLEARGAFQCNTVDSMPA